ncbi:hypothetical protein AJ78_03320 [Emergomyces pasteurianus Ep9510]|uniref:RRM domain-containing protein n=1 Tax=Emergomyces pasteurianus Ep9510 TaxID=1447872 RepID=A0A1J9Q8G3_9EURO|nr:hypothetical protein AJ78_03320 [Emergomyces pasteurianus Ep9510]
MPNNSIFLPQQLQPQHSGDSRINNTLRRHEVAMTTTGTTRLHISPLTPELLHSIVHLAAVGPVTGISYHSVQTFPENNYGFVNLSKMEAEKVVKKLNGTILKGKKLKIHEARSPKRRPTGGEAPIAAASTSPQSKPEKNSKKRKSIENIVDGYEMPPERLVKRGWTEPADKNKRSRKEDKEEKRKSQRSKYTEKPECLFRVSVPPNRAGVVKEKEKSSEKRKNKKNEDGKVVVHEFENLTTIPSFLRTGEKPQEEGLTSEYVDGKGWVDRAGNVKEEPVVKGRHRAKQTPIDLRITRENNESSTRMAEKVIQQSLVSEEVDSDETSSSGSSSESFSQEEDSDSNDGEADDARSPAISPGGDNSASLSSSSKGEEDGEDAQNVNDLQVVQLNNAQSPVLITPNKGQTASIITKKGSFPAQNSNLPQSTASGIEVHPLEALFKRPAESRGSNSLKLPLEINTQFSFFGVGDDDTEEADDHTGTTVENRHTRQPLSTGEPQTPFTKRDLMSRIVRSAAPTPDTAAPHKTRFWADEENGHDQDGVHDGMDIGEADAHYFRKNEQTEVPSITPSKLAGAVNTAAAAGEKKEGKGESDFSKWFWENRGDNNRAWKSRRREAAKEKRQRENRQKGVRGK